MQSEIKQECASLGSYRLGATMGKGGYAKVKVGLCNFTKREYAIKIFKKKQTNFSIHSLHEEVQTLKLIKHKNVPRFIECYESVLYVKKNGQRYEVAAIVMEYVQNGELFDFLAASEEGFSEDIARTLFRSLIETVGDIHNEGIAHRDLKIENLLLDKDFNPKIADFGLASKIRDERGFVLLKGKCGTPEYMAPETWFEGLYNGVAVDIFACGVILFQLMTEFSPFYYANKDKDALYHRIAKKDYESFWETFEDSVNKALSPEFKDLINSMLALDPNQRPTIQEIKDHSWFKGPVLTSKEMKDTLESLKDKVNEIRLENHRKEKEKAADIKALLKKMQEAGFGAPFAFTGVNIKR